MINKSTTTNHELDTTGLRCPEPMMLIRKTIRQMQRGDTLHIITDDPSAMRDVSRYCLHMGHTLIKEKTCSLPFEFWICKGE